MFSPVNVLAIWHNKEHRLIKTIWVQFQVKIWLVSVRKLSVNIVRGWWYLNGRINTKIQWVIFTITTTVTKTHCTKHRGALPIPAVAWNISDKDTSHLQLWYWKYNIESGFHQQNGQGFDPGMVQLRRSYEEASKPKAPLDQRRWVDIIL